MLIGYIRVSSADERQSVDLQRDALIAASGMARCSSRAAAHTSRAASAFMAAIPRPTIRSGHAERQTKPVIAPAAMMAMFASASLRAERNAARVRLPL